MQDERWENPIPDEAIMLRYSKNWTVHKEW